MIKSDSPPIVTKSKLENAVRYPITRVYALLEPSCYRPRNRTTGLEPVMNGRRRDL
jgi:hypothetical protein